MLSCHKPVVSSYCTCPHFFRVHCTFAVLLSPPYFSGVTYQSLLPVFSSNSFFFGIPLIYLCSTLLDILLCFFSASQHLWSCATLFFNTTDVSSSQASSSALTEFRVIIGGQHQGITLRESYTNAQCCRCTRHLTVFPVIVSMHSVIKYR